MFLCASFDEGRARSRETAVDAVSFEAKFTNGVLLRFGTMDLRGHSGTIHIDHLMASEGCSYDLVLTE